MLLDLQIGGFPFFFFFFKSVLYSLSETIKVERGGQGHALALLVQGHGELPTIHSICKESVCSSKYLTMSASSTNVYIMFSELIFTSCFWLMFPFSPFAFLFLVNRM